MPSNTILPVLVGVALVVSTSSLAYVLWVQRQIKTLPQRSEEWERARKADGKAGERHDDE